MKEKAAAAVCFTFVLINFFIFLHHGSHPYVRIMKMYNKFCDVNNPTNCKSLHEETPEEISFRQPYAYSRRVDLRLIVLTWNRSERLKRLLDAIKNIEMDGDEMAVEIWVDRLKNGSVDKKTLLAARNFALTNNHTTIHVHPGHAGLYVQWIATYSSAHLKDEEKEIVLILEDDLVISKFGYKWLKAVHEHFKDVPHYLGTSLRFLDVDVHSLKKAIPRNHSVFMHRVFSTHAFSPKLKVWRDFQGWFVDHHERKSFKPYVPGIISTDWYKQFEKQGRTHTMWSMWFLYYTYVEQLFAVYANPAVLQRTMPVLQRTMPVQRPKDKVPCFCTNGQAKGLHFEADSEDLCRLVDKWSDEYVAFPENVLTIDWNGLYIKLSS